MKSENKPNILLVEDDAIIAALEKEQLEDIGYSVHHVLNGEDAVQTVLNSNSNYDLILMDIDLGSGIDGTQAAEQILDHKDIPVVFLSSHIEPAVVEKTEKITSYGYVVKNTGVVVLDVSIKMALKLFAEKTEKKKAESQFKKERELLDYIMGVTGTGYDIIDSDFNIHFIDNNWKKIYGDPAGRKCYEYFNSFSEPCPGCGIPKALETKEIIVAEEILSKEDNRIIEVHTIPFRDSSGQWLVAEFNIDVTARKAVEEDLRRSRDLLDRTQQIGRIGGWEWDVVKRTMIWTDETYRIHGMNPGDLPAGSSEHIERSLACYDPSDRRLVETAFSRCRDEGIAYDLELPLTRVDGKRIFIRTMAEAVKTTDRIVKVVGNIIDITSSKQAEEEIQKQLAEKEILLREVHHRVKNNIANIESLLSLQARSEAGPEVRAALQRALSRVQSIRILYDKLLLGRDFHDVSIKIYAESLIDSLLNIFDPDRMIVMDMQIADFTISSKKAVYIGIIINELLTNIFKYAFSGNDKGAVFFAIEKSGTMVTLTVHDDGIGVDERNALDKSSGFGVSIIQMLVEQLHGTYSIHNENGTKSVLRLEI